MSIELLERAATQLGPLLPEVAFVGGATVGLWLTDPAAPDPRPTTDVDIVVEVTSRGRWHDFEERLRARGFREDSGSPVICRWRGLRDHPELILDAMPAEARLLGFENRWQKPGLEASIERTLPSGISIRGIPPPYLVATKLEAWLGRGGGDHLVSHDLEDVIRIVDGRAEIAEELDAAPTDLADYIAGELTTLLDAPRFIDAVYGTLTGPAAVERASQVVLPRLRQLAER